MTMKRIPKKVPWNPLLEPITGTMAQGRQRQALCEAAPSRGAQALQSPQGRLSALYGALYGSLSFSLFWIGLIYM